MSRPEKPRVLIVDDDQTQACCIQKVLAGDFDVELVASAQQAIARARGTDYDIILTDQQMPGMSGLELLNELHPMDPTRPIIIMTGFHTPETTIEAMRLGAFDYIVKPTGEWEEFLSLVKRAAAARQAALEQQRRAEHQTGFGDQAGPALVGQTSEMRLAFKQIGRVAASSTSVLIRGETGTGKELVARKIHQHSQRGGKPLVIVNCVAIPDPLLEKELFGHEAGAFTGAQSARPGKFEQANLGTIFLDEVGDMSPAMQARLLRVLEQRVVQRLGGREPVPVDVRVIAATHCDLEQGVRERRFREDLYYRLNDAVIRLPPLRERRDDIGRLARAFLGELGKSAGTPPSINSEGMRFLEAQFWPGNVRQLKNVVEKAVLIAGAYPVTPRILKTALGASIGGRKRSVSEMVAAFLDEAETGKIGDVEKQVRDWAEKELFKQALELAGGDKGKVAGWLGVSRPTLRERIARYNLACL